MTRSRTLRPVFGLVAMLLALAVVAMHQLNAGHHSAMPSHAAMSSAAQPAANTVSSMAYVAVVEVAPTHAARACADGCSTAAPHRTMAGHGESMLCLAVVPLLLVLVRRRRVLTARAHRAVTGINRAALRVRWPEAAALGPPGPSLTRLCVSRT